MIRFFFSQGDQLVMLPVNPAQLQIKAASANKTTEVVNLGEINILRDRKLTDITIESFFPEDTSAPFVLTENGIHEPKYYLDFFLQAQSNKQPLRLIITDTTVNILVSIESFAYGLVSGSNDYLFSMDLKEYRAYRAKDAIITPAPVEGEDPVIEVPAEARPATGFAIGDTVAVSGHYHSNSYGTGSFGTFPTGFVGKISHIVADPNRRYRYHIQTVTGAARGWVAASQLIQQG